MKRFIHLSFIAVLLALILIVPVAAENSNFDAIVTTGDISAGDDLTVTDQATTADLTTSDDLVVGDDLTVAGDVVFTAPVRAVVGITGTLAPTTANVPISSTASSGVLITCEAGKIYYVTNVGAQSIIITDSGTMKLQQTVTLGALDTITLRGDGTNCIEFSRSNN